MTATTTTTTSSAIAATRPSTSDDARLVPGAVLENRYRLVRELGRGGFAVTWEAEDQTSGARVAVKILSLRTVDHWKAIELFEREARVLRNLDHPAIPRYLDFIAPDDDAPATSDRFVLVQALAPGRSLAELVKSGWRPTEAEARDLADQVLRVLEYLHGRSPPVVHRDIKPANLVRGPDGKIALVDFGSVRDRLASESEHASTAGTFGYMAPEQLTGRALPASDLYGLGATLVNVLSHRDPADLPQRELRMDFSGVVHVSPGFGRFLRHLTAPAPEQRYSSAETARRALARVDEERESVHDLVAERVSAVVEQDALVVDFAAKPRWGSIILAFGALAATAALLGRGLSGGVSPFLLFCAFLTALVTWRVGMRAARSVTDVRLSIDGSGTTITRRVGPFDLKRRHLRRGEPVRLESRGWFRKRDVVLHTRGKTERLGYDLDKRAVQGVEERVRRVQRDLA